MGWIAGGRIPVPDDEPEGFWPKLRYYIGMIIGFIVIAIILVFLKSCLE